MLELITENPIEIKIETYSKKSGFLGDLTFFIRKYSLCSIFSSFCYSGIISWEIKYGYFHLKNLH